MSQVSLLKLNTIRTDGGTQPRAELNEEIIKEYRELWESGATFPAVSVVYDGDIYWLVDGFHRVEAAKQADQGKIEATIIQGTHRDAILLSCKANAKHGLRRTNEDKRRAVTRLLSDKEWAEWSDRKIAEHCVVNHAFVAKLRKNLSGYVSRCDDRKAQRGESTYTVNTAPISTANTARAKTKTTETTTERTSRETEEEPHRVVALKKDAQSNGHTPTADTEESEECTPSGTRTDSLGRRIPEKLQPTFDILTPVFKEMRSNLLATKHLWKDMEDHIRDAKLTSLSGNRGFITLRNRIKDIEHIAWLCQNVLPFTTCVYCKLTDPHCQACGGSGVITEESFQKAPEAIQAEGSLTLRELNKREGLRDIA